MLSNTYCSSSLFIFKYIVAHRDLHSFPTRRSSDLGTAVAGRPRSAARPPRSRRSREAPRPAARPRTSPCTRSCRCGPSPRSEEHTSELQSHSDLVCRLLLEKKKKKDPTQKTSHFTY